MAHVSNSALTTTITQLAWGTFDVPLRQVRQWQIGPLRLWVARLPYEWRLAWEIGPNPHATDSQVAIPAPEQSLLDKSEVRRFGTQDDATTLRLSPLLADLPVISRPEKPFAVPPGEAVTLYMGTPLWLRIEVGAPKWQTLIEMPVVRPPRTWFGDTTVDGELCYASRSFGRVHLADVQNHPHRAVTAARIQNRSDHMLVLDRLCLPVAHLALYKTNDGWLWTQNVLYERTETGNLAVFQVRSGPDGLPRTGAHCVAEPRHALSNNPVIRAFSNIFAFAS